MTDSQALLNIFSDSQARLNSIFSDFQLRLIDIMTTAEKDFKRKNFIDDSTFEVEDKE